MIKYLKSDNTGKLEAIHQKCGFMDMSGNYVINPRFDFAEPFSEGLALVSEHKHDLRCGFVDKLGNYVIRPQFDNANSFSDGLAAVDVGNWSYGFIDKTGTIVIEPQFEEIYKNFRHGFAEVGVRKESKTLPEHVIIDKRGRIVLQNMELGKYDKESGLTEVNVYKDLNRIGYIDKTGKCVINPIITYASYGFKEGIKMVLITGKWGGIDKKGNFVIKPRFDKAAWFSEGLCGVMTNNKWGFVNQTGNIVIEPLFYQVQNFSEGLAAVTIARNSKWGFVNKDGEMVIKSLFDSVKSFVGGLCAVKIGEKWGFIDKRGELVINSQFDDVLCEQDRLHSSLSDKSFIDDTFLVKYNEKWGIIDKSGEFIVSPQFDSIDLTWNSLDDGIIRNESIIETEINGKYGLVDRKTGRIIAAPQYDSIDNYNLKGGLVEVENDGKYGVLDTKTGETIVPTQYDRVSISSDNCIEIKSNGKEGIIDINTGVVIVPTKFDSVCVSDNLIMVVKMQENNYVESSNKTHEQTSNVLAKEPGSISTQTNSNSNNGCYVATSIYGSYNCPEVWTLHRFRDNILDATWYGRAFIKTYYAISPTLVKWFGESSWFKKLWRRPLDKMVTALKNKGVEDTPYQDKY